MALQKGHIKLGRGSEKTAESHNKDTAYQPFSCTNMAGQLNKDKMAPRL